MQIRVALAVSREFRHARVFRDVLRDTIRIANYGEVAEWLKALHGAPISIRERNVAASLPCSPLSGKAAALSSDHPGLIQWIGA